jgi:cinnamoyl-CoA reductase
VTGAGGFIGSWAVKELLLRGYRVFSFWLIDRMACGRLRQRTAATRTCWLLRDERLTMCRADVLNYDSLRAAFSGGHGVFHVASPVSNDPVSSLADWQLLQPST